MRAILGPALVALAVSACATAGGSGTTATSSQTADRAQGQDVAQYSAPASGGTFLGQSTPYARTRADIEASGWTSRGFYPPEYCWVIYREEWNTQQYWDIRRWCDKREMRGDTFL